MCKFIQITSATGENLYYISKIFACYKQYSKFLHDDFITDNGIEFILNSIPYLWAICKYNGEFAGFAILDNFIGNDKTKFSAEITTCFDKNAWGNFTKYAAKIFLKKCFDELGLYKIIAQIFPDNHRVKNLLKSAGFCYEATIPNETLRNGKFQSIDLYSINKNYYYKNEGKNYD